MNKVKSILMLIIFIAGLLRFYNLSSIPVSLYWDEVSQGYNAYSISETFRDEYGNFFPLLFKAFNDYKMPVNVYLTAFSIKLFGLNEFATRFPSAFLGTLTVLLTFFFVRKLFSFTRLKNKNFNINVISLLSTFLLAISPWHIQFSRGAFEANVALFFIVFGVYLLIKGLSENKYYFFSIISFVLAFYGYRSIFVFLPILLISIFLIWKKELLNMGFLKFAGGQILFAMLLLPLLNPLMHEGFTRAQQTTINNEVDAQAFKSFTEGKPVNKKLLYGKIFIQNYLSEFSPQFLFISGDPNGRHSPRGMGLLYFWEMPFLLLGLFIIIRHFPYKIWAVVIAWLLAAPIPAALSIPAPHALRTLNMLPIPQILTSVGLICLYLLIPRKFKKAFIVVMVFIIGFYLFNYIKLYSISNTKLVVSDWGDGYKQLISYIKKDEHRYDKIIITGYYWQPYIYTLFYCKYDPKKYQTFGSKAGFDKYIFGSTEWDRDIAGTNLANADLKKLSNNKKTLVSLSPMEYFVHRESLMLKKIVIDNENNIKFYVGELL